MGETDFAKEIERYQHLLDSGSITEKEFEALKRMVAPDSSSETNAVSTTPTDQETIGQPESDGNERHDHPKTNAEASIRQEESIPSSETSAEIVREETTMSVTCKDDAAGSASLKEKPILILFDWRDGKLLPCVFDGDKRIPYPSFIKPVNQTTRSFCKEVAEMIERDLGRPVKYVTPKDEAKARAAKPGHGLEELPAGNKSQAKPVASPVSREQPNAKGDTDSMKTSPKTMLIVALIVIAAVFAIYSVASRPNLKAIYGKCCSPLYAELAYDGSYLSIDTNPHDIDQYTDDVAYESIQKVNSELNLPESVWSRMKSTRALDGTQTFSSGHLEVYWTYHPSHGMEVTYSIK